MQSERPRAVGLPSGPGPRSRARSAGPGGRSRREASSRPERDNERDTPSSSRPARGQRPVAERSRRSEDSSSASSSASGSSLFDRMKTGAASYASSFTSVEDEEDKSYNEDRGRSQRNRNRYQAQGRSGTNQRNQSPEEETEAAASTAAAEGYGGAIWTRVATAASGLTVSVSKAWATNVATYAGEETPPGQESRLTRAMKAYHLEKARDPSDLPPWLFEEHERRAGRVVVKEKENREKQPIEKPIPKSSPRGLRDIYDSAAVPGAINQSSGDVRPVKKTGTDRLRALREARMPNGASATPEPTSVGSSARAVPQRVGLPVGPGRVRRV